MTNYNKVFGDETIPPNAVQLREVVLDNVVEDIVTYFPFTADNDSVLAAIMYVTGNDAGDTNFILPDARTGPIGYETLWVNNTAATLGIYGTEGNLVATVLSGEAVLTYLIAAPTEGGTWGSFTYGTGTSSADAAALAGNGLVALNTTLNGANPVIISPSAGVAVQVNDRCTVWVMTASLVQYILPVPISTEGNNEMLGWYVDVINAGSGSVTIEVDAGAAPIDGLSTKTLSPGETCRLYCDGTQYYSFGYGRSSQFNFTALVKDLTAMGPATITLTNAEASNKVIKFIGAPTGPIEVIAPSVVNVYFVQCAFTGPWPVEFRTEFYAGVGLSSGDRTILYCDGQQIVAAQTVAVGTSISVEDGSAAAPSINFTADTDTGFFRSTTDTLGVAAGGAAVALFSPTGINSAAIGTTTPSTGKFTTLTTTSPIGVAYGGTGYATYTIGDLLYASGAGALSKLAGVATGNALISGGVGTAPSWGKIGLTTHVSGILPVANGGIGTATYTTGDIIYADGANSLARRGIGSSQDLLVVSGGIPVWASQASIGLLPPFFDSTGLVKGSVDVTKILRFEVDGFTTATTRTITPPNADASMAATNLEQTFTAQQTPMNGTLTDGATINWDGDSNGQVVTVTTAAARTFAAPTNINQNASYMLVLTSGNFLPSWNAAYKWASGTAPTAMTGVVVMTFVGGASNTLLNTGIIQDVR